jgi:tetratricopeptide (TPR) repeat protein
LRSYPDYTDVLNNRGLVYYNMGRYELAAADYLAALRTDKDNSRIMINLMLSWIAADELEKASQQFALYKQKNLTGYMEAHKAFAFLKKYISACVDYVRIKDYQKALPLLLASLEEYMQSNQDQGTNRMLNMLMLYTGQHRCSSNCSNRKKRWSIIARRLF